MPLNEPNKIAYLFGAGATQAELATLNEASAPKASWPGILMGDVSRRVIEKASRDPVYLEHLEMVSSHASDAAGSLNIELLISLIESSKIVGWEGKTHHLKELVKEDIQAVLTRSRVQRFWLHKALLELHSHPRTRVKERLIGLISLNYDDVLDRAHKAVFKGSPDYCFALHSRASLKQINAPLLKLHGSFNWATDALPGRRTPVEIIPVGANKNYLHVPYGFIWSRALEILIECDTLRIIGCSLSPNDVHLIDLFFKAHLERGRPFLMEVIGPDGTGDEIKSRYGFFPKIDRLTEIEAGLVPGPDLLNPFKMWLKHKSSRMLKKAMNRTRYLRKSLL